MSDEMKKELIRELTKGNVTIGQVIMEMNGNIYNNGKRETEKQEDIKMDRKMLLRLVNNVQEFLWGQSAYAVLFCLGRDRYGYPDNMSQFERELEPLTAGLDYECHAGTVQKTLSNNPYMKLPISKWAESGAPKRVLLLTEKINEEIINCKVSEEEFLK